MLLNKIALYRQQHVRSVDQTTRSHIGPQAITAQISNHSKNFSLTEGLNVAPSFDSNKRAKAAINAIKSGELYYRTHWVSVRRVKYGKYWSRSNSEKRGCKRHKVVWSWCRLEGEGWAKHTRTGASDVRGYWVLSGVLLNIRLLPTASNGYSFHLIDPSPALLSPSVKHVSGDITIRSEPCPYMRQGAFHCTYIIRCRHPHTQPICIPNNIVDFTISAHWDQASMDIRSQNHSLPFHQTRQRTNWRWREVTAPLPVQQSASAKWQFVGREAEWVGEEGRVLYWMLFSLCTDLMKWILEWSPGLTLLTLSVIKWHGCGRASLDSIYRK